jgi:CubicO group peptidase (beta-lactamase class C family)
MFAAVVSLPAADEDSNAAAWGMTVGEPPASIDGEWSSRWNVDSAGDEWSTGSASIESVGDRVYMLYHEGEAGFLIEARREGEQLIGKYLDLQDHRDSYAWYGRIVDNLRIDGAWVGGRWDFRRQLKEGNSEEAPSDMPPDTVASLLDPLFDADSPGAAVLVIRDGEVEHQAGYGLADLERNVPITEDSLFHLASTGKQFTALCVIMLKEEGRLAYDDTIGKHLPELARLGDGVTIRRLLHHTSGVPEYYDTLYNVAALSGGAYLPANGDGLLVLSKWASPAFPPGERFEYSNTGYEVLGSLIERLSGQSFADFVRTRLFEPLGMNQSFSLPAPTRLADPKRARGYQPAEGAFALFDSDPLDNLVGSGSIFSSLADLRKYNEALNSDKLLSQAALKDALEPARLNDGTETGYLFAQFTGKHHGHRYLVHSGGWVGYVSTHLRFPDDKLAVILLWNRNDVPTEEVAFQIADLYLAGEPKDR